MGVKAEAISKVCQDDPPGQLPQYTRYQFLIKTPISKGEVEKRPGDSQNFFLI